MSLDLENGLMGCQGTDESSGDVESGDLKVQDSGIGQIQELAKGIFEQTIKVM